MKTQLLPLLLALLLPLQPARAQDQQLSTARLQSLRSTQEGSWVSIHDPSVVCRNGRFHVWGSHLGYAHSTDLQTWTSQAAGETTFRRLASPGAAGGTACTHREAFNIQQVTQVKGPDGQPAALPVIDAEAYCARYAADKETWIDGNMWAPDLIWNERMQRWCLYLSLNGDHWASIIVLLTAPQPEGPFTYQGPVVMGGFNGQTSDGTPAPTHADTDLALALGQTLTATPPRYLQEENGTYWPNCIDPCVFYDEEGRLWMTYGSWSGGIWMLRLDEETGLRDYTHTYPSDFAALGARGVSDPYFGIKIAGGCYVSGEGSYIQHIGGYYYLFLSYGFFAPDGGYDMRVFRSTSPTGPYTDARGNSALFTDYHLNYGPSARSDRGMRLMGAYNRWGPLQSVGECAQGHNSACTDGQGRHFVVYHTKFNNGTGTHQVRVRQLFQNEQGWLVAAPFVYAGETAADADVAAGCPWSREELAGDYEVMLHPFRQDHANFEETTPVRLTLQADGSVSGAYSGTWGQTDGTAYAWLRLDGTTYYGLFCEQPINGATPSGWQTSNLKAIAFTALAANGVPLWGYKLQPPHAIAWNHGQHPIPLRQGQTVTANLPLWFDTEQNTTLSWSSSQPEVITPTGHYAPRPEATPVTLTARLASGGWFWEQAYNVTAQKEILPAGDWLSGLVAYYDFDTTPTFNRYKPSTQAAYDRITYGRFGHGTSPCLEADHARTGQVVRLTQGANGQNSYARMPNPLLGQPSLEGFTLSLWVKRADRNLWDALWAFAGTTGYAATSGARFFLTGNAYAGYNDGEGTWFDLNRPADEVGNTDIPVGQWALVTVTVGSANGVRIYVNGVNKTPHSLAGSASPTSARALPVADLLNSVASLRYLYLGNGSFWGSAAFRADDLLVYTRELSATDVRALHTMSNRLTDFTIGQDGTPVSAPQAGGPVVAASARGIYDLSGRRLARPVPGVVVQDGRKMVKK